jgi:hypothetical protein
VDAEIDAGPGDGGGKAISRAPDHRRCQNRKARAKVKLTVPWSLGKESSAA